MENLVSFLKTNIYHPVRSRIIYDFLISLSTTFLSYLFLFYKNPLNSNLIFIFVFPVLFLATNILLGLYSKYRLGTISQKSIIILFAGFLSGLVCSFFTISLEFILFSTSFTILLTITPRIFVNVNKTTTTLIPHSKRNLKKGSLILVTGGGGFIGSVLVEKLLKKGYKIRVIDKFIYGKEVFSGIRNRRNLELMEGDITDPFTLTSALLGVEAVIHLAGIVGESASALDEIVTRHINIMSTQMLKETVKALGIQRFLFASTTAVYEGSLKVINENIKPKPTSIYTKTKYDSEKELLYDTHDSFHPTILRISTAFGHSRKPKFDLVANLFVAQAIKKGNIHVINKNQWRSFIHVSDIADAFIKVLEAPLSKVSRQVFNVGNDKQILTLSELALLTQKTLSNGKEIKLSFEKRPGLVNYKISFQKLRKTLHFTPKYTLEQSILEIYDNFKKGIYKKPYTDPYYTSYEGARRVMREFYTAKYRKKHYSTLFSKSQ